MMRLRDMNMKAAIFAIASLAALMSAADTPIVQALKME